MIRLKPTLFLGKKIGALLILIFTIFFLKNDGCAQDSTVRLSDLRKLAKRFQQDEQYFLSYIYNISYYHLEKDSTKKLLAAHDALKACVATSHFEEGMQVTELLINDFPKLSSYLKYQYGYILMRSGEFGAGDSLIRSIPETGMILPQIKFLLAFSQLTFYNNPSGSMEYLSQIDKARFPSKEQLLEIKTALTSKPPGTKKYKLIAVPLSMIIPGSGQIYSGFYFDGIQSFGFNMILGYAAYASWRHELNIERRDRNYVLPVLSTIVSGLFYISNIVNTFNAVDKANLYNQNKHYSTILDKFHIVMKDEDYFLNMQLRF